MRHLPKLKCQHCGSTWFREAPLEQFETLESDKPKSRMRLSVLICLCGAPVPPKLGGVRGGRTANLEISAFMNNFDSTVAKMPAREDAESLLAEIQSGLVHKDQLLQVVAELKAVERRIGRWLGRAEGKKAGRHWEMPRRSAATSGRDQMVVALQRRSYTFRKARWLVGKFWKLMARLLRRGEAVDTPLGTFTVVRSPKPQVRRRFGKRQTVFSKPLRIRFRPREI
jgi:hypothetical protein